VLAEFLSLNEVLSAADHWRRHPPVGALEFVPAARTILIRHDETFDRDTLQVPVGEQVAPISAALAEIDVHYDGDDLDTVAATVGLDVEEVIRLHTSTTYTVAFCGFMPGFSYLVGLPPALHLPRRATPRTRVPAGSVAIASEFSAIYPRESPGGWHLLGRTSAVMWNEDREAPALLPPGTSVRFRPR